jgi:glucosamine 6-phosphate synthetase-like amidotransferase/phosphosugar isomerase protein
VSTTAKAETFVMPIVVTIPVQLLAYHTALVFGVPMWTSRAILQRAVTVE